ncbi:MAG: cysteine desulfurase [Parcubacteria group bacterium]|nr:cysteine desulfurase [Parcubacteria group bacterium]
MFWKKNPLRQPADGGEKRIYLDYVASTPVDADVLKAMMPYFAEDFGNANSIHQEGAISRVALDMARKSVADILNAKSEEIVFTSGGTESNTLAIVGIINSLEEGGKSLKDLHAVTSTIEHPSVLEVFKALERQDLSVTYVDVDETGVVNPKDVREAIKENTKLVSIMYVNNEIGTIQPIAEIAKVIRHFRKQKQQNVDVRRPHLEALYFHTDASQAPLYLPLNTIKLGVDMMTLGGHKMYGPKGVGCLYIKKGTKINLPKKGTENIPLIVGFAKALELAEERREREVERVTELRDYFIKELKEKISELELNGSHELRAPNNVNIYIPNIDGEFLTVVLDNKGIACSTKSACKEDYEDEGSYVIRALGYSKERSKNSLRLSLGKTSTKKDIDYVVKALSEAVKKYSN